MSQEWKCWWGMHHLEVIKTEPCYNKEGCQIGYTVVSRCKDCGVIQSTNIKTLYDK